MMPVDIILFVVFFYISNIFFRKSCELHKISLFFMYFNRGQRGGRFRYIFYIYILQESCVSKLVSPFKSICGDLNSKLWPLSRTIDVQIRILMLQVFFPKRNETLHQKKGKRMIVKKWNFSAVFNNSLNHKACACGTSAQNSICKAFLLIFFIHRCRQQTLG